MGILGERGREVVEDGLHGAGGHLRQHEGEVGAGGRAHGAEQIRPFAAPVAEPARALAANPPAEPGAAWPTRAVDRLRRSTQRPQLNPLARVRLGRRRQRVAQPLLAKAALAFSSASGCSGRVFCRDRSRRRRIRDRLAGCCRLPKRRSIQRQSIGRVQSEPPSSARWGRRKTASSSSACSASVSVGVRPGSCPPARLRSPASATPCVGSAPAAPAAAAKPSLPVRPDLKRCSHRPLRAHRPEENPNRRRHRIKGESEPRRAGITPIHVI